MAKDTGRSKRVAHDSPAGRIRAALGVPGDEPMPRVRLEPLRKYHAHLAAHLTFPFEGRLMSPIGPHRDTESPLTVLRLLDPVREYAPEEMYGLICKAMPDGEKIELPLARIDVTEDDPNWRLLEDYPYWFSTFA